MKTKKLLAAVVVTAALCGCAKETGDKFAGYFGNEDPVDLSDVLKAYEENKKEKSDDTGFDLDSVLFGSAPEDCEDEFFCCDSGYVIELPQYAGSAIPYLAQAEDFYNSCLLCYNVWSNYEAWTRETGFTSEITEALKSMAAERISDPELRRAAQNYRDSVALIIQSPANPYDDDTEVLSEMMSAFGKLVTNKSYRHYTDLHTFVDSIKALHTELLAKTKERFNQYKQPGAGSRAELTLRYLTECKTFDEQCSLLLNWAYSENSIDDEEWIMAVSERLMRSGKYNPFLSIVLRAWRSLFQLRFCGMSRDSAIPNDYYNSMRKLCFLASLKRIEQHPDDPFAMDCASSVGGMSNIWRLAGGFGNSAMSELVDCLPKSLGTNDEESRGGYDEESWEDDEESGEYDEEDEEYGEEYEEYDEEADNGF